MPIEFDLGFPKEEYSKSVQMIKLKVNGVEKPIDATISFRQLRLSISPSGIDDCVSAYGLIEILVPLGYGHTSCSVELEFQANKAFPNMGKREYIYIDIPYVTESMVVEIIGSKMLEVCAAEGDHGDFVEATSYIYQRIDHSETQEEKKNLIKWQNGIEWKTHYPKLGYRYLVWFQVRKRIGTSSP